jgi:hypothetical protein
MNSGFYYDVLKGSQVAGCKFPMEPSSVASKCTLFSFSFSAFFHQLTARFELMLLLSFIPSCRTLCSL